MRIPGDPLPRAWLPLCGLNRGLQMPDEWFLNPGLSRGGESPNISSKDAVDALVPNLNGGAWLSGDGLDTPSWRDWVLLRAILARRKLGRLRL